MKNHLLLLLCFLPLALIAQTTFTSPGQQTCGSTNTSLPAVTASDGVTLTSYLWLDKACLNTNLSTFSLNSPAIFRNPTYCYNNGYFPTTAGYPVAIARNSTANSGNCAYGRSNVVANFTSVAARPKGLTFTICDVDNPYDSIEVRVYSGGATIPYSFIFADPNPATSFAWSKNTTGSGTVVQFNGGANGVWGESSGWQTTGTPDQDWARGAIYFSVDPAISVDSVVMTSIIRNNRNDINAAESIGDFKWITNTSLPVTFGNVNTYLSENKLKVQWTTISETDNDHFNILASKNGTAFTKIGSVPTKAALGNSSVMLSYDFETTEHNNILLSALAIALFGGLLVFNRKNKFLGMLLIVISPFLFAASCTTSSKDNLDFHNTNKVFVKIIQVNKDGKEVSSKTFTAVKKD